MKEQVSMKEWADEGIKRFGPDMAKWQFVCPACGHIASARDWMALGAPTNMVGFSCVGNWMAIAAPVGVSPGPCVYQETLGGLNPMEVIRDDGTTFAMFAFADPNLVPAEPGEAS